MQSVESAVQENTMISEGSVAAADIKFFLFDSRVSKRRRNMRESVLIDSSKGLIMLGRM